MYISHITSHLILLSLNDFIDNARVMFSRYTVISSKNNDNFAFSFPVFILLTSLCFLTVWASTSRTVLIMMVLVEIFTLLLTLQEMLLGITARF